MSGVGVGGYFSWWKLEMRYVGKTCLILMRDRMFGMCEVSMSFELQ